MELEPIEDFRRVRHTTGEEGGMQVGEVAEEKKPIAELQPTTEGAR